MLYGELRKDSEDVCMYTVQAMLRCHGFMPVREQITVFMTRVYLVLTT
jgi:hypothetical protein